MLAKCEKIVGGGFEPLNSWGGDNFEKFCSGVIYSGFGLRRYENSRVRTPVKQIEQIIG